MHSHHGRSYHLQAFGKLSVDGAKWIFDREHVMHDLKRGLDRAMEDLGPDIGLIGTGMSGALLVPSLADMAKVPFVLYRHEHRSLRSPDMTGPSSFHGLMAARLIFVDDLIDFGKTVKHVAARVKAHQSEVVGGLFNVAVYTYEPKDPSWPSSDGMLNFPDLRIPFWMKK